MKLVKFEWHLSNLIFHGTVSYYLRYTHSSFNTIILKKYIVLISFYTIKTTFLLCIFSKIKTKYVNLEDTL